MAVFHTHREADTLSPQDKCYIQTILAAAARANITTVYFPVISLEKGTMEVYRGDAATLLIQQDTLELIEIEKA